MSIKDLKGQKFDNLTVIRATTERQKGSIMWKCKCKCGKVVKVRTDHLTSRHTKSCGCLVPDQLKGYNQIRAQKIKNQ